MMVQRLVAGWASLGCWGDKQWYQLHPRQIINAITLSHDGFSSKVYTELSFWSRVSATLQDAMGKIAWFGFNVKLLGVFFLSHCGCHLSILKCSWLILGLCWFVSRSLKFRAKPSDSARKWASSRPVHPRIRQSCGFTGENWLRCRPRFADDLDLLLKTTEGCTILQFLT